MARRKSTTPGDEVRSLGVRILLVGFALLLLPSLFASTVAGPALKGVAGIGLLILAVGALIFTGPSVIRLINTHAALPGAPEANQPRSTAESAGTRSQYSTYSNVHGASTVAWRRGVPVTGTESWGTPQRPARPTVWGASVIDAIEWRRFEAVVERLFAQGGFITKSQSHGADGGIDIWLFSRHHSSVHPVSIVQCKHWIARSVGVDKVRELRGVMAQHGITRGQFVTSSVFTEEASSFGQSCGINLVDRKALLALISRRSTQEQQELLAVALEGEYWRPTCASCGTKMIERLGRSSRRPFWGCSTYPRCKSTLPFRQ
jgi:restriction system protein